MNISTGRKWAVHRRRVSMFADGELEVDDAKCVSHIAALFESCCRAVVTAEAVVVAGKKWAADGESMSADGELEGDDAMCVSHIAALFESCCRAVVTAEAVVVAGGKWAADRESMSADGELEVDDAMSQQQRCRSFFRHSWTDDHLKVMKRRWQCGQNLLLAAGCWLYV